MELRHLRYFRVVAEELHLGRAAARLHMEPQPLSFQIKQLEHEVGFALFSHRENRTHLTAAGDAFLGDAEAILASAEQAVERARRVARGESGLFRIGSVSSMVPAFLAPAIKQFRSSFPEVTFALQTLGMAELERALNREELDVGFTLLPVPDENYEAFIVSRTRPILAVPASDPLANRGQVTWRDLDGREAIELEHCGAYQRRMDEALAMRGVSLKTIQRADTVEAALAFVGVGLGVALVHELVAAASSADVVFVDLPPDAGEHELGAIWRRNGVHPLRARFLETVAAIANADEAGDSLQRISA